ncbi:hypothetical protein GCM10011390_10820 [Aureimonas endophytica]|uniref:DUF5330 domain-containing protein n=1 Tax=Aureimonas endophytica TaxID=2027858 RepID=A0A916ZFI0_9HYPH|nr:DUF5330 domain-containing protein [Aureimonas endophytica]GGD93941.1 hypothetical protein GCM10011390_10820 [Aureimonas endophytica]
MIRFVIKCALGLGLVAMVLPLGRATDAAAPALDPLRMFAGIQEAAADIGSFCTRAPAACAAARDLAAFAGDRIEAGLRIGYRLMDDGLASREPGAATPQNSAEAAREAAADPAALHPEMPLPQPYQPPRHPGPAATALPEKIGEARPAAVPIPTPRG